MMGSKPANNYTVAQAISFRQVANNDFGKEAVMREHIAGDAMPFLVNFATTRTPHPEIGGRYCAEQHVWVEDSENGTIPMVLLDGSLLAAVTKTMTQQEADDEIPPSRRMLPELATKTEVQQESDDQISSRKFLLELETKTSYQVESDDQPMRN